jgi:hypothetical protein
MHTEFWFGKPGGKKSLKKYRRKWGDNIKRGLKRSKMG